MPATHNFRAVARTIGMGLPLLALLTTSCNRDPLAPDCFIVENGVCLIPYPGASEISVGCEQFPEGAVGAEYEFDLNDVSVGGTGSYGDWSATNLPPGLTLDPVTGIISGVPTEVMAYLVDISVKDVIGGGQFDFSCGELVINPRLSALGIADEPSHCVPHTASKDEMIALLDGGDGSEITCSPLLDEDFPCPKGDGNGQLPAGVSFSDTSCTHSGNVTGDRRGTWVWMVEIEQSGYTTRVPFCASRDIDTFHEITLTANNVQESDLEPGLLEHSADELLTFGNGTHVWEIDDVSCNDDPVPCNSYGFTFTVTCSPFDEPFELDGQTSDLGMTHQLTAQGPVPSEGFRYRPWVASFDMSYCTAENGADCDTNGPNFEQNAQTQYHYDVVGFPNN